MGEVLGKIFINPSTPQNGGAIPDDAGGFVQVLFLGLCYGFLLLKGSNLISSGSELLLLIPEAAGIVGSVVLPVLGAVPDGAIVLFSGLGPADEARAQLMVGVGALAGSTVMLLTVPWFLSVVGGGVSIVDGEPCYSRRQRLSLASGARDIAATSTCCVSAGVAADRSIRVSVAIMLTTCILGYLVVEVPALLFMDESTQSAAKDVAPFAWVGAILCFALFIGYLVLQFRLAKVDAAKSADSMAVAVAQKMIAQRELSLGGVLSFFAREASSEGSSAQQPLTNQEPVATASLEGRLRAVVRPFFNRYDVDGSGALCREELTELLTDLGERVKVSEIETLFASIDEDGSGSIDYDECVRWLARLVRGYARGEGVPSSSQPSASLRASAGSTAASALDIEASARSAAAPAREVEPEPEDGDTDSEPEIPEDIRDLSPAEQRQRVLRRSFWQMGLGTVIVLLISDPMVDVLDTLGGRTGIPAFYVAFLLAPVASNASEMIASYRYAQKKTQKTITIAFAQLLGAACMNNTFCLGIFYLLVAGRGFGWTYHAEVVGTIVAEFAVACMAYRKLQRVWHGAVVLSILPLSLMLVYVLKNTVFKGKEV